jgi:two-component system sensor histidine kinase/response regulator
MDGYITKPIGLNDIEKTLTSLSPAPSAVPAGPSGKLVWGKAEALDRLGGDEALLLELCQIFLEESPKQLQKVRQAVAEADAQAVMRAAHCLKGELGYLGAAGASQAAQQFEDMGHENDLSHAAETLVVLEREMASLHLALKDPSGAIQ